MLPDDCSECDFCGIPILGWGTCDNCLQMAYERLGFDKNGNDKNGKDGYGRATGYLKRLTTLHNKQLKKMYPNSTR